MDIYETPKHFGYITETTNIMITPIIYLKCYHLQTLNKILPPREFEANVRKHSQSPNFLLKQKLIKNYA